MPVINACLGFKDSNQSGDHAVASLAMIQGHHSRAAYWANSA